jgi:hypothetical protein
MPGVHQAVLRSGRAMDQFDDLLRREAGDAGLPLNRPARIADLRP